MIIYPQVSADRAGGGSDISGDMAVPVRRLAWRRLCANVPLQHTDTAGGADATAGFAGAAVRKGYHHRRRPAPSCLAIINSQVSGISYPNFRLRRLITASKVSLLSLLHSIRVSYVFIVTSSFLSILIYKIQIKGLDSANCCLFCYVLIKHCIVCSFRRTLGMRYALYPALPHRHPHYIKMNSPVIIINS